LVCRTLRIRLGIISPSGAKDRLLFDFSELPLAEQMNISASANGAQANI